MAFGSEVTAKLGIDTSSVPGDLAKAKNAMGKFADDAKGVGGEAGDGAGQKLVAGLEHRILGARHLSGVLATALGLNIEKIAHSITAAIVGGTKEAWQEAEKIADESTKRIAAMIEARLTPKQLQEKHKRDLTEALDANANAVAPTKLEKSTDFLKGSVQGSALRNILVTLGLIRSDAEKLVDTNKTNDEVIAAGAKVEADRRAGKEADKKLTESVVHANLTGLNTTQQITALEQEKAALTKQQESGKLTIAEIDERAIRIGQIDAEIGAKKLEKQQLEIDQKHELLRLQESLNEAHKRQADEEEKLANKKADRGKETIGEIANLKAGKTGSQFGEDTHVDTFGLSAEAAAAKEQATEIQRLQKQAEGLRTSGDVAGANSLFDQIGAKKQGLVDSGFAKSTAGDDLKQLREAVDKGNSEVTKILSQIQVVAQGKLKNQ